MLIIIGVIVAFVLIKFYWDVKKEDLHLEKNSVEDGSYDDNSIPPSLYSPYKVLVDSLNSYVFNGEGDLTKESNRAFNLYKQDSNEILRFIYAFNSLIVEWRFKYYQKELVHKMEIGDIKNFSTDAQVQSAKKIIFEMEAKKIDHKSKVLGG